MNRLTEFEARYRKANNRFEVSRLNLATAHVIPIPTGSLVHPLDALRARSARNDQIGLATAALDGALAERDVALWELAEVVHTELADAAAAMDAWKRSLEVATESLVDWQPHLEVTVVDRAQALRWSLIHGGLDTVDLNWVAGEYAAERLTVERALVATALVRQQRIGAKTQPSTIHMRMQRAISSEADQKFGVSGTRSDAEVTDMDRAEARLLAGPLGSEAEISRLARQVATARARSESHSAELVQQSQATGLADQSDGLEITR